MRTIVVVILNEFFCERKYLFFGKWEMFVIIQTLPVVSSDESFSDAIIPGRHERNLNPVDVEIFEWNML
jgi:hypothetical protein